MKMWQPVKASQSGPAFSHLLFADDLIFFAKADWVICSAIRDVLDEFCEVSGQTVSEAKSRVYFSPNVDRDTGESLCDILGFASTLFWVSTLDSLQSNRVPHLRNTILYLTELSKNSLDRRQICYPWLGG